MMNYSIRTLTNKLISENDHVDTHELNSKFDARVYHELPNLKDKYNKKAAASVINFVLNIYNNIAIGKKHKIYTSNPISFFRTLHYMQSVSIDKRVQIILNSRDLDEVQNQILILARLLNKSKNTIAINFGLLARDLYNARFDLSDIQRQWADSYYGMFNINDNDKVNENTSNTK